MSPGIGVGVGLPFVHLQRRGGFSPASLFSSGEEGAWYDPSDLSTLWQDAAGTTPVTAADQPVGRIDDKSGNGNHATQSTAGSRPLYKTAGGLHWLEGDGVDDRLEVPVSGVSGDLAIAEALERLGGGTGTEISQVDGWHAYDGMLVGFSASSAPKAVYRVQDIGGPTDGQVRTSTANLSKFVGVGNFGTQASGEANGVAFTPVTQGALSRTPIKVALFGSNASLVPHRRIFGLVCLDRTVTTAEIAALRTYLAEKSGVTL